MLHPGRFGCANGGVRRGVFVCSRSGGSGGGVVVIGLPLRWFLQRRRGLESAGRCGPGGVSRTEWRSVPCCRGPGSAGVGWWRSRRYLRAGGLARRARRCGCRLAVDGEHGRDVGFDLGGAHVGCVCRSGRRSVHVTLPVWAAPAWLCGAVDPEVSVCVCVCVCVPHCHSNGVVRQYISAVWIVLHHGARMLPLVACP